MWRDHKEEKRTLICKVDYYKYQLDQCAKNQPKQLQEKFVVNGPQHNFSSLVQTLNPEDIEMEEGELPQDEDIILDDASFLFDDCENKYKIDMNPLAWEMFLFCSDRTSPFQ